MTEDDGASAAFPRAPALAGAAVTVGAALLLVVSLPEAGTRVLKACAADPVEVEAELEATTEPDADDKVAEPVAETVVDPDADVDEDVWVACALETTLDA